MWFAWACLGYESAIGNTSLLSNDFMNELGCDMYTYKSARWYGLMDKTDSQAL